MAYKQGLDAAAAKSFQSCPTLCDPRVGSPPGSPSLGFSRQEHWSGLPFLSPVLGAWESQVKAPDNSVSGKGLLPSGSLSTLSSHAERGREFFRVSFVRMLIIHEGYTHKA